MGNRLTTLPAGKGKALLMEMEQRLAIVNTHGTLIVDCRAVNAQDLGEAMSMPHTRNAGFRLSPAPRGKPGDRVGFRAEMPCIVVLSACPHDIFPINGPDSRPRNVEYAVLPAA